MKTNETTTTAAIFLGLAILIVTALTVSAVESGRMAWPPWADRQVEEEPRGIPQAYHPSFYRPQPKLHTDHEDEQAAAQKVTWSVPELDTLGLALSAVGLVWLLVEAFSQGPMWGVAVLFGNLLGGFAFLFAYPARAWRPLSVQCIGYLSLLWASISAF